MGATPRCGLRDPNSRPESRETGLPPRACDHGDVSTVQSECFLLGATADGVVVEGAGAAPFGPTWVVDVEDGESPLDAVLRSSPVALRGEPHSTSWRYEGGAVVLTWVAFPAEDGVLGSSNVVLPYQQSATTADRRGEAVAAHAVRHVAFLLATDEDFDCPSPVRQAVRRGGHVPDVFRDLSAR